MKNKINNIFSFVLIMALLGSCETTELNLTTDPNSPNPENLDVDFTLNNIQLDFAEVFEQATEAGGEAVRLEYMFDEYDVNYNSTNSNTTVLWRTAYANVLQDIETLIPIAESSELFVHSGIARVIKAYTLMTLVDYFGDVPLTTANNGDEGELFPTVDEDTAIYDLVLTELDNAIADFEKTSLEDPANDLYYDGDVAKWTALVNTLKLKYYLNLRLSDEAGATTAINTLLNESLIDSPDSNFVFQFGTSDLPQSKHQYYVEEYEAASPGEYITNYLMWSLAVEKGIDDPRLRYYVYRQVGSFPSDEATLDNEIDCWNDPRPATYGPIDAMIPVPLPFCSLFDRGDGYWGRNHSDSDGIPPDNTKRSTFGTYPIGGRYDADDFEGINSGDGLNGQGIWPIMMNSFTYFMRAEAALILGTSDDDATMLEEAVRASITDVQALGASYISGLDQTYVPTSDDVDEYVTYVMDQYNAATTEDAKMAIIGKEYWIASFGNGVEAYNLYRRTGTPINMTPTLLGTSDFPRTFLYPAESVDRNFNIDQKSLTDKTFWDTNADGFIY
ncbi:SusD/RagB family nutrient-binding outer membrane lipoprotein [Cellulophaga baltica]|uniref:SusD/RagB family nutrient-binding outer membrane lipoprotein n=1 Tax=Cellulophaga TaxID=104264 RepID=UPI001C06528B|nr:MULTISPECIES: SusD/RagB family nutrient-binding outer membrane lipoprotein [Cellulophaga]MBU2997070.1 SusD/RagB family nutrient-binding outer membrane lipoprotein [Cellulophaga baltica]MDO6768468.1 SusD/RagB family nutrient-binding outer membrane lipoprotein [Cellulophaga sp. 1_MG-2023]